MSVLYQKILLKGSKGQKEVNALFDSGASYSFIKKVLAEQIANIEALPEPMEFGTAKDEINLNINYAIRSNFYINDSRFSDEFLVSDEISEDLIIGAGTLQRWRFKLDFENDRVLFDPRVNRLIII